MKKFKIQKYNSIEPKLFGLTLNMFFLYLGIVVMMCFLLIGKITSLKVLVILLILLISYFVLKFIDGDYLKKLGDDNFPEQVIIDKFR